MNVIYALKHLINPSNVKDASFYIVLNALIISISQIKIISYFTNLSNINGFINTSSSGLNVTGAPNINFKVGSQLTTINTSG